MRAEWIPFQAHCYSENLVAPGIEPGTSVSTARFSFFKINNSMKLSPSWEAAILSHKRG
jgi:hypothetical protein